MKFTVMHQYCEEVKNYFDQHRDGKYGAGVKLLRLDKVDVSDVTGGEISNAYAYRCKGSFIAYLWHKLLYGKYAAHFKGWY